MSHVSFFTIQSLKAQTPSVPEAIPTQVSIPNSPEKNNKVLIESEAQSLFIGNTTMAKLLKDYDSETVKEIVKRNNQLDSDDPKYIDKRPIEVVYVLPRLSEILSTLANYKKIPRTESAETEFSSLINKLNQNYNFKELLKQYRSLMKEYPERTEEYEAKAVLDFVELYPELVND